MRVKRSFAARAAETLGATCRTTIGIDRTTIDFEGRAWQEAGERTRTRARHPREKEEQRVRIGAAKLNRSTKEIELAWVDESEEQHFRGRAQDQGTPNTLQRK